MIVSVPRCIILGVINIICRKTLSQNKPGHPTELVTDGNSSSIIKAIINLVVKKKIKAHLQSSSPHQGLAAIFSSGFEYTDHPN